MKQYGRLFEMEDVELSFADEALNMIARKAIERKTGARGLRSILEGILLETMYDLPGLDGVNQVVISPRSSKARTVPSTSTRRGGGEREERLTSAASPVIGSRTAVRPGGCFDSRVDRPCCPRARLIPRKAPLLACATAGVPARLQSKLAPGVGRGPHLACAEAHARPVAALE